MQKRGRSLVLFVSLNSDIFRPYPGYICSRLIHKEAENGRRFYYCFVDFENPIQSTICLQTLQVLLLSDFLIFVLVQV